MPAACHKCRFVGRLSPCEACSLSTCASGFGTNEEGAHSWSDGENSGSFSVESHPRVSLTPPSRNRRTVEVSHASPASSHRPLLQHRPLSLGRRSELRRRRAAITVRKHPRPQGVCRRAQAGPILAHGGGALPRSGGQGVEPGGSAFRVTRPAPTCSFGRCCRISSVRRNRGCARRSWRR